MPSSESLSPVDPDSHFFEKCIYHEINNPLAAMMATIEIIKMKHRQLPAASIDAYMDRMMKNAVRIQFLLNLRMKHKGHFTPELERVQVDQVIENVHQVFADQMQQMNIRFLVEDPTRCPVSIAANQQAVEEILINLIKNSIEASKPGMSVILRVQPHRKIICFEIRDEGSGISEEQKKNLFTPFITYKHGGTGLGLFYSRFLAEQMNGALELAPLPSGGTLAKAAFPRALDNRENCP